MHGLSADRVCWPTRRKGSDSSTTRRRFCRPVGRAITSPLLSTATHCRDGGQLTLVTWTEDPPSPSRHADAARPRRPPVGFVVETIVSSSPGMRRPLNAPTNSPLAAEASHERKRVRWALVVDRLPGPLDFDLTADRRLVFDLFGEGFGVVLVGGADQDVLPAVHRQQALPAQFLGKLDRVVV